MIDLSRVRRMLDEEVADLVNTLDGIDLDDIDSIGTRRSHQASKTRELLLLESKLTLAAQLVKNEYWFAKGEVDPLDPERE